MIKAVVFDFDGLILDTETPWYDAFSEIYKEHGAELPIELWGLGVGTSSEHFDPYAYLAECTGSEVDKKQIDELFWVKHGKLMESEKVRPGVVEYLRDARKLGLRIGLASSSPRSWIEKYLRQHGLFEWFEVIKTADDVSRIKPDPELYTAAAAELGVKPEEAVAFEDSPNGTRAAKSAGMYCVIVPNRLTSMLTFDEYDLRISSMAELPLAEVMGRFGN
ncbi:HAD family hydrolase [Paenibacillus gansuensis]|uniref:HAD family hydrolase n=1 Tax=Paenibacillus gansuensis TaxID=306542 RepID=A0ABW5PC93_9BACL